MAFETLVNTLGNIENTVGIISGQIADYDVRQITGLIPNLFLQHGWSSTMYLINALYLPGIQEFEPPTFGGVNDISNMDYEEVYTPNYSFPIGRRYKNASGSNNSDTQSGYFNVLRQDLVSFLRWIETPQADKNNMLILEVMGSARAEPTVNSITVYKNVKLKSCKESTRKQGDKAYTGRINLIFTERPHIYTALGEV
jgi:hypothetical protein